MIDFSKITFAEPSAQDALKTARGQTPFASPFQVLPQNYESVNYFTKMKSAAEVLGETLKPSSLATATFNLYHPLVTETGKNLATLGRAIPRSILSTALTLAPSKVRESIGQIIPEEDMGRIGEILLGQDAIGTIPIEGAKFLTGVGVSDDTANQWGWLSGLALTAAELFP